MPEVKLSVLMPAFEEGRHIYRNLAETRRVLQQLGQPFEIIVIDDCSSDNTAAEVERAAVDFKEVRMRRNEENRGKGWSLKSGFKTVTGDLVAFVDADLDIHPDQLKFYLRRMEEKNADVVIGSKRHPESVLDYPFRRKVISTIYFGLVKALFGLPVQDTQTGLKLFRREVLERTFHRMLVKRWAYDLELLVIAHRLGYKIVDAPVKIDFKRRFGRMKIEDLYYTGIDTLGVFYRLHLLRFYDQDFERTKARPKVSVLVPSKEQEPNSTELLEGCLRFDYPDYEIIALSDGPSTRFPPGIKVLETGKVSTAVKKNIGARNAGGRLLAFVEPGNLASPDWLTDVASNFVSPDVAAVVGPELIGDRTGRLERILGDLRTSFLVSGPAKHLYSPGRHRDIRFYSGNALVVRSDSWSEVGGFPEGLPEGWENAAFTARLAECTGRRILYDPDAATCVFRGGRFKDLLGRAGDQTLTRAWVSTRLPAWPDAIFAGCLMLSWLALLGGWVPALWSSTAIRAYAWLWAVYGCLLICSAALRLSLRNLPVLVLGTVLVHFAQGLALWRGFFRGYGRRGRAVRD